ncbi:MAG: PDZ domain-containing protein [Planctomycetes bacterium]|nr:PDZ domain-containing protein [Planctomycetota bacterium]
MKRLWISLSCILAAAAGGCTARPAVSGAAEGAPGGRADFRQIVQHAKDRVFPAVVYIKCLSESHETGKRVTQEVAGSGVIISPTGEILTNWHVVDKAVEVRCLLLDGSALSARVVGSDKDTDLALIQLDRPEGAADLPFAPMGQSAALREGDFVMAMGAPWGMNRSVSIGIISCTARYLPERSEYTLWLQTDAAISPGNSGGPLVDTEGRIIGINTLGILRGGGDTGFAIPSDTAGLIVERLRRHGKADWTWTGLQLQPLRDFDRAIYFEGDQGVIVAGTDLHSPARRAGLLGQDRILRINGRPVTARTNEDLPAVRRLLGLLPAGQQVALEVRRGGEIMEVAFTPRDKGDVEGEELDCPRWDMTVKTINQFDNPDLHFHRPEGVYIFGVKSPGNASAAGLREQDIILTIDGRTITTLDDLRGVHVEAVENVRQKHRVVVSVLRNGLMRQVVLDFSRDYEQR